MKTVGILLDECKFNRLLMDVLVTKHDHCDVRFVQLDPSLHFKTSDPLDAIVHKYTALWSEDSKSVMLARQFYSFLGENPSIICIDPPGIVMDLLNRHKQFKLLDSVLKSSLFANCVRVSRFCLLPSESQLANSELVDQASLSYPLVCKPLLSHGSGAHHLQLVFNREGLEHVKRPSVAQEFINHDGVIFKLFIIGDMTHIQRRTSIANLVPSETMASVLFNSKNISKTGSTTLFCEMSRDPVQSVEAYDVLSNENMHLLTIVGQYLRTSLKVDLLGVDIIPIVGGEESSCRWAVIDANYFPGYDDVPHFHYHLENLVRSKLSLPMLPAPQN